IAAASHPELRFFSAAEQFAQEPATNVAGQWRPLSPATAADCSAVAYYFGRDLQRNLKVPVGLLISSVGGTRIETWMQSGTISNCAEAQSLLDAWKNVSPTEFRRINQTYVEYQRQRDVVFPALVKQAQAEGKDAPHLPRPPSKKCHTCPSALHNGMIAPLQPFAIRGALWYQGESNVSNPAAYEKFSPLMIADWRRVWGDELPFLFVQLPPYKGSSPDFREAQFHIWQHTPRTAMVVTTDVGNADNVHPTIKMPVGERLALAARAIAYGEPIEYCGPVFASMTVTSNRAVISFTHLGGGLVAQGGSLKGFSIAGKDGRFVEADAVIEGSTVVVTSEKVSRPVAVRYGWSKVPDVNLFNQEGLPAVPFRTDAK
ncbi:MAG: sialate O-acetylesterase, partial [Verrucomicrobiota bacterium]